MRKYPIVMNLFFLLSTASYSQNAYTKCVQECMLGDYTITQCQENCSSVDTTKNVDRGQGNPLYLFSYELKGPAPVIDGSLMSRDGDPSTLDAMDEWKSACSRTIILNDSGIVQLFLTNSPDTLYVGLTYEHGNDGNGSGVRLLFDQGNNVPPSPYHGSTDMRLDAPKGIANENGCYIYKWGGSFVKQDLCWNGSSWIIDRDGQTDFRGASYFYNTDLKVHHSEFAIPLHNGKTNDSGNADLNVNYNDVIGFYLEIVKTGEGAGTFHWIETNGNPGRADTFPYWAKIQLSVKRDYFTFYPGRSGNPGPVIDGSITEPAWNGAYQRELLLSNFHYGSLRSKIWCIEDSAQEFIDIGVRVFDKVHNPQDYCQIYFEEDGTNATNPTRNYFLDNNAENALRISNDGQMGNLYWNNANRTWAQDPAAADSQRAKAGANSLYTDYEFKVKRSGGMYNIDIPKGGFPGFLIRYHDADRGSEDLSNFYWEYTTNNDAQLLDNPSTYIATGWTNMQLGGPYIRVISPTSSDSIRGTISVKISSGNDSLKSVVCFLDNDTTAKVTLVYQGGGIWTGTITTPAYSSTPTLIIRVVSLADLSYERIVNKVDTGSAIHLLPQRPPAVARPSIIVQSVKHGALFKVQSPISGPLSLSVFTVTGKRIWTRRSAFVAAGVHQYLWDWNNGTIGSGAYLAIMNSGGKIISERFSLMQ
jgi:hypothetical protein